MRILFSKKMNLGLDAIETLMSSTPLGGEHRQTLNQQIEAEISAIRFHKQTLARLFSIKKIYEDLEECRDHFCLKPFPACRALSFGGQRHAPLGSRTGDCGLTKDLYHLQFCQT